MSKQYQLQQFFQNWTFPYQLAVTTGSIGSEKIWLALECDRLNFSHGKGIGPIFIILFDCLLKLYSVLILFMWSYLLPLNLHLGTPVSI